MTTKDKLIMTAHKLLSKQCGQPERARNIVMACDAIAEAAAMIELREQSRAKVTLTAQEK